MISDVEKLVTPSQLELLALVASGYTGAEIAQKKFLSEQTVWNTLVNAKKRVGARNTTHLCVICLDYGLIKRDMDYMRDSDYKPVQQDGVVGE